MYKTFHSQCCEELTENDDDAVNNDDLRSKILLHPGPFVKPRNVIRRLTRSARTEAIVNEMRALQELGYGTRRSTKPPCYAGYRYINTDI